jgi:hypothetical protein
LDPFYFFFGKLLFEMRTLAVKAVESKLKNGYTKWLKDLVQDVLCKVNENQVPEFMQRVRKKLGNYYQNFNTTA